MKDSASLWNRRTFIKTTLNGLTVSSIPVALPRFSWAAQDKVENADKVGVGDVV